MQILLQVSVWAFVEQKHESNRKGNGSFNPPCKINQSRISSGWQWQENKDNWMENKEEVIKGLFKNKPWTSVWLTWMLILTKLAVNAMRSGCSRAQKEGAVWAGSTQKQTESFLKQSKPMVPFCLKFLSSCNQPLLFDTIQKQEQLPFSHFWSHCSSALASLAQNANEVAVNKIISWC